jgi:hypothetical protein
VEEAVTLQRTNSVAIAGLMVCVLLLLLAPLDVQPPKPEPTRLEWSDSGKQARIFFEGEEYVTEGGWYFYRKTETGWEKVGGMLWSDANELREIWNGETIASRLR